MAYTTINKSTDYFNTKLYTGNDADNHAITGVGFQPDLLWIKQRGDAGYDHSLTDSVRTSTKMLYPDLTRAEDTHTTGVKSYNSDGFTLGTDDGSGGSYANLVNYSKNYVAWTWKANGAGSANTDGSINTTATSANTTAGFSISKYTGTGSNATVGHGLGVVPKMIIVKRLNGNDSWWVYNEAIGNGAYLVLSSNGSSSTSGASGLWNSTSPTSSVFSVGTNGGVNASGGTYVAYCFADVTGYSKFGSYYGNGSTDGQFIYTSMKPAWVMIKALDVAESWWMFDNKRSESNVTNDGIIADSSNAEYSDSAIKLDLLSNGFKLRTADASLNNASGYRYIYMAFAKAPLVGSNNVPCTAR